MFRNYLKIAWRNLIGNKVYSAVTILGLAFGLAVSLLSILYVTDELSYDHFHVNAERIYRINTDLTFAQKEMKGAASPTPMGQTLKQDFQEVEAFTRLGKAESMLVKKGADFVRENRVLFADSTLFDVFTLPVLEGNPKKALTDPFSIVITKSIAQKYFGAGPALNKTMVFSDGDARKVTAVIENIPVNSHFQADFLLPLHATKDAKVNKWGNHIFNTYLLLKAGTKPESVEAKFEKVLQVYLDPALKRFFNTTLAETRKAGNNYKYSLMPLTEIHLYSDRAGELSANSSIEYIYLFSIIAFFILLIAVFNFINLSTARSARRAREVGVRKVMGSNRSILVFQFLSESMLTTFLALISGLILVVILLPFFNQVSGKNILFMQITGLLPVLSLLAGTFLVGLAAGLYPAFYLSSFQPIQSLKGKLWTHPEKQGLRNYLVVFQFSLSILLVISTILVKQQLNFIQTKKIGFDKEQVLIVKTSQSNLSDVETFKREALRSPAVRMAAISGFLPVPSSRWNDMWYPENQTDQKYSVNMQEWKVDTDYIPTLGMKLVQGRNFSAERIADSTSVIINESGAKRLGYQNPIGKVIHKTGGEQMTIIGVVQDFHYESLRSAIEPVVLAIHAGAFGPSVDKAFKESVSIRLATGNARFSLSALEKIWKDVSPGQPFEYSFLSDDFDTMYRTEQRIEQLFSAFAGLAILIASLGLFGLSAFSAEQRTGEIGVRKVLGASVGSIVILLSRDFLKPVLISVLIASPVAWYALNLWLENFAYKTAFSLWIFVVAGALAVTTALLTVSFQSIRAAMVNPVKSLKMD